MKKVFLIALALLSCVENDRNTPATNHSECETSSTTIDVSNNRVSRGQVRLAGKWGEPPNIVVCDDAGITQYRLEAAVRFWENLGYQFGDLRMLERADQCPQDWGTIVFRMPTQAELTQSLGRSHLATTKRYALKDSPDDLVLAEIYFVSTEMSKKKLIVEHEIGHALGWLHSNKKRHIMYPKWIESGILSEGVLWEDYQSAF